MNNIIDTSGWLEYFADGENSDVFAGVILSRTNEIIVPVIVIYEIFKKILMERDEDAALQTVVQLQKYHIENIDDSLSLQAAKISCEHKIPMADSMIYAVTLKYNAVLWTQDEHFERLPSVKYIGKKKRIGR